MPVWRGKKKIWGHNSKKTVTRKESGSNAKSKSLKKRKRKKGDVFLVPRVLSYPSLRSDGQEREPDNEVEKI